MAFPPSWESFIQTISGRTKLPKFDKLWAECTREETRIAARQRLHGTQPEENQAFVSHAKKGKGRGRGRGSHTFTSIKIRDQVLPQIRRNKRRIYLSSNATGARNTVIIPVAIEVLIKGSMKVQLLM